MFVLPPLKAFHLLCCCYKTLYTVFKKRYTNVYCYKDNWDELLGTLDYGEDVICWGRGTPDGVRLSQLVEMWEIGSHRFCFVVSGSAEQRGILPDLHSLTEDLKDWVTAGESALITLAWLPNFDKCSDCWDICIWAKHLLSKKTHDTVFLCCVFEKEHVPLTVNAVETHTP